MVEMGINPAQAASASIYMEILYAKLTWFSAESETLVILVLYFTLIWGVNQRRSPLIFFESSSPVPKLICANSEAAGGCAWVTAELLSACIYGCVSTFCELFWGGRLLSAKYFRAVHLKYCESIIGSILKIVSWIWHFSTTKFTSPRTLLISKLDIDKETTAKRCLPPNVRQRNKTNRFTAQYI